MIFSPPFDAGRPVTVLTGAGFDPATGDPTPPTGAHVIAGCAWAPRTQGAGPSSGSIDHRGRQGLIEGLTLYAPAGATIDHTHRMVLDAELTLDQALAALAALELWEVDGDPGDWWDPFTGENVGLEVSIRRFEG